MFWLESGPLTSSTANIVYICRPRIKHVKVIAGQFLSQNVMRQLTWLKITSKDMPRSRENTITPSCWFHGFRPWFLGYWKKRVFSGTSQFLPITYNSFRFPKTSYRLNTRILWESYGLWVSNLILLYSVSYSLTWKDGDETVIFDSAQALLTIQKLYGTFPQIIGKGDYAQVLSTSGCRYPWSLMESQRLATLLTRQNAMAMSKSSPDGRQPSASKIDSLIILDRRVDMITPLLTQLTYEGLVDELIGIKNCGLFRCFYILEWQSE
jgi:hypothetical protein